MKWIKLSLAILVLSFGVFMVIYGGYDDSPGGQLLGVLIAVGGICGAIRSYKRKESSLQDKNK
jgi:hypothetical protein